MDSGRKQLAAILAEALPDMKIVPDSRVLDSVLIKGACVVWANERKRAQLNGFSFLTETIELWVLSGVSDVTKVEDDLDDLLVKVLEVLDPLEAFKWDTATRSKLDNFPAWKIDIQCGYTINSEDEG